MRIALIGAGAFGEKHLAALLAIPGAEVATIVSASRSEAERLALAHGLDDFGDNYEAALGRDDVDAVILATPTPLHARQAIQAMDAGKHVQIEIPLCDKLAEGEAVLCKQVETGLVCMVGHTRRFNPSHRWVKRRIQDGFFTIQAMDVQTFFLRRTNTNARGEPRSWTDHLLWHHAAHTVDLFRYMTGHRITAMNILQGRVEPELGIAMNMSIQMRTAADQILTLALSFDNDGPFGSVFRYIGDTGTYVARYDELLTGNDEPIDVSDADRSTNGIELQDREFIDAILENREPLASVSQVIECYRTLDQLERQLL